MCTPLMRRDVHSVKKMLNEDETFYLTYNQLTKIWEVVSGEISSCDAFRTPIDVTARRT